MFAYGDCDRGSAFSGGGDYYFDTEESDDDDYCWWKDNPAFAGYTRREVEEQVIFLRPDGNTEGKDVGWCISNGFEEVEDGLWSGPWYWRKHAGGEQARKERLEVNRLKREKIQQRRQQAKHAFGAVGEVDFEKILRFKQLGNEAFSKGNFVQALEFYDQTDRVDGRFALGLLPDAQKEERVKILSNKAECYLRLHEHFRAGMAANEALILDKRHEKSLIRRAKANYFQCQNQQDLGKVAVMAGQAIDDLTKAIQRNGAGKETAQKLIDEINEKLQQRLDNDHLPGK